VRPEVVGKMVKGDLIKIEKEWGREWGVNPEGTTCAEWRRNSASAFTDTPGEGGKSAKGSRKEEGRRLHLP